MLPSSGWRPTGKRRMHGGFTLNLSHSSLATKALAAGIEKASRRGNLAGRRVVSKTPTVTGGETV